MARSEVLAGLSIVLLAFAGCLGNPGTKATPPEASDSAPSSSEVPTAEEPVETETPPAETTGPDSPEEPANETDGPGLPPAPVAATAISSTSKTFQDFESDVYFEVKSPLILDAGKSTGENITFAWDLGDGRTATTAKVEAMYILFGDYAVKLVVTDGFNRTATAAFLFHALPPMAAEGDAVVGKRFTEKWDNHIDPTTQKPIVKTHEFPVPLGTKRLDVIFKPTIGGQVSANDADAPMEIEMGVLNITGKNVVPAKKGPAQLQFTILTPELLTPGYWQVVLTPHRAPGVSYALQILAWTVEPKTATFTGAFADQDSANPQTHALPTEGRVGTFVATLDWDGPDPDATMCGDTDAVSRLSLSVSPAAGTKFDSDHHLACEHRAEDKDPGQAFSENGTWSIVVTATPEAVATKYVVNVLYA